MKKKNKLENKVDSYWDVIPPLKEPLTKIEITDLMLDDILKLKDYVKESNEKEINKYSRSIRNYSKILKYDISGMLEKIIKSNIEDLPNKLEITQLLGKSSMRKK